MLWILPVLGAVLVGAVGVRWWTKRRGQSLLQESLRDSKEITAMKMVLGDRAIQEQLPYLKQLLASRDPVTVSLVLEIVSDVSFAGKEALMVDVFHQSPLEIQLQILNYVFAWNVSFTVLPQLLENLEPSVQEYVVRALFLNYRVLTESGHLDEVLARADAFSAVDEFADVQQLMHRYLFSEQGSRTAVYDQLLGALLASDHKEDLVLAAEIVQSYLFVEDESNTEHVQTVLEQLKDDPEALSGLAEAASVYDHKLVYLKKYLARYYGYEYLTTVCRYYQPLSVLQGLGSSKNPLLRAYMLYSAASLESSQRRQYRYIADELFDYVRRLDGEMSVIAAVNHDGKGLLLEELGRIRESMALVLFHYFYAYAVGVQEKDVRPLLATAKEQKRLPEALHGVLSSDKQERLLGPISGDPIIQSKGDSSVLTDVDALGLLENIYRFMGGEPMETAVSERIEKMIALKKIPMFSELDVMTLFQILQIASYRNLKAGEVVVEEGDPGSSFFTLVEGEVGIYKGDTLITQLGAGEIVGELAVIDQLPRTATVKTLKDTVLLVVDADDFVQLLGKSSSISLSVIKTLTTRLRDMMSRQ